MNEKVDRKYKLRKEVKNSLRSLCVLFYLYLMIFLEQFMDLICWIHNSTDCQIVIQGINDQRKELTHICHNKNMAFQKPLQAGK